MFGTVDVHPPAVSKGEQQPQMEVKISHTKSVQETLETTQVISSEVISSSAQISNGYTVEQVDLAKPHAVSAYSVVFIPQTRNGRQQLNDSYKKTTRLQRPSAARGNLRSNLARNPMAPVRSGFSQAENRNAGGEMRVGRPSPKSIKASFVETSLPVHEDQITTRAWLRLYSLSSMNLDLVKIMEGPNCEHVDDKIVTLYNNSTAKHCYLYPCINVNGNVKHLQLSMTQLEDYEKQVSLLIRRYLKRMIWLLSGSRLVFGTIVHRSCLILIDTSGSMAPYIEDLKKELVSLIKEQFSNRDCCFNLMCFSGKYEAWSDQVQPATADNCQSAIEWVMKLKTSGSTKTLEALRLAFGQPSIDSIYLLTDGKPDMGASDILNQALVDNTAKIPVNTTSYNCNDITANSFLQSLASQTGGRYHRCHQQFNGRYLAQRLQEEGFQDPAYPILPTFESDDLSRLGQEVSLARKYLHQVKQLRNLYGQAGQTPGESSKNPQDYQPVLPRMERSLSVTSSSRGLSKKTVTTRNSRSTVPQQFNFFRDVHWVPGVWRTYWKYPPPRHVITGMIDPLFPDKEEQITSEEWLNKYMVSTYKLHLKELLAGEESPSKFSDIYARFSVRGKQKFLRVLPQELIYYEILMERVYKRYLKRLHWLLTSSRLVFGTIIHKNCVIVVDTSGSMGPSMHIMKEALVKLIWEQISSHECMFTLVDFSADVTFWNKNLQPSTKENCESAIAWVGKLNANGGTNTMDAIRESLQVPGLDSVYLLSDGAPQQTPADILNMVETQFQNHIPINTISFNCPSKEANKFLEDLSTQTDGRYHLYLSSSKALQVAPMLLQKELSDSDFALLSELEGKDLRMLVEEMKVARKYLQQVRQYKSLSQKKEKERPFEWAKTSVRPKTQIHKFFVQRPATHGTFMTRPKSAME